MGGSVFADLVRLKMPFPDVFRYTYICAYSSSFVLSPASVQGHLPVCTVWSRATARPEEESGPGPHCCCSQTGCRFQQQERRRYECGPQSKVPVHEVMLHRLFSNANKMTTLLHYIVNQAHWLYMNWANKMSVHKLGFLKAPNTEWAESNG